MLKAKRPGKAVSRWKWKLPLRASMHLLVATCFLLLLLLLMLLLLLFGRCWGLQVFHLQICPNVLILISLLSVNLQWYYPSHLHIYSSLIYSSCSSFRRCRSDCSFLCWQLLLIHLTQELNISHLIWQLPRWW